jgi:hypothetical protein
MEHPYRDPSEPASHRYVSDREQIAVYAVLGLVGVLGVIIGVIFAQPTELTLGGLIACCVLSAMRRELRGRGRERLGRRDSVSDEEPPSLGTL